MTSPPNAGEDSGDAVNVLPEEDFTEKIRQIIKRDFFPDLDIVRKQNAYLDAIKEMDVETIAQIEKCIKKIEGNECIDDDLANAPKMSLDEFLAHNTSCDNIAFERVMEKLQRADKLKPRYAWLYQNESAPELTGGETGGALDESGQIISERSLSKAIDTWPFKAKNNLMYYPDGENKKAPRDRQIDHLNTRLPEGFCFQTAVKPSAHNELSVLTGKRDLLKRGGGAVSLTSLYGEGSIIGTDKIDTVPSTPSSWLAARYMMKRRALESLVPSTPTPQLQADQSPFMTWGQVEGTPIAQNTPAFRIPETPERDLLARKLAEEAGADFRKRKQTMLKYLSRQSTPGTCTPDGDKLTPCTFSSASFARRSAASKTFSKGPLTATSFLTDDTLSPLLPATPKYISTTASKDAEPCRAAGTKRVISREHKDSPGVAVCLDRKRPANSPGILRVATPK